MNRKKSTVGALFIFLFYVLYEIGQVIYSTVNLAYCRSSNHQLVTQGSAQGPIYAGFLEGEQEWWFNVLAELGGKGVANRFFLATVNLPPHTIEYSEME